MERETRMPVLEQVARQVSANGRGEEYRDVMVLHINHCMDNSLWFSDILHRFFERTVFVGVPYNDNRVEPAWSFPFCYGIRNHQEYELWDGEEIFGKIQETAEKTFLSAAELLIERALKRYLVPEMEKGKRLLILEDGGYHYPVVEALLKEKPYLTKQICGCVEQTASGTRRGQLFHRQKGVPYTRASISRSDIKMYVESCFIGHRVVEELAGFLSNANRFLDFHNVLLLGYGIIGRQVALDLKARSCFLQVYDPDPVICATAEADGCRVEADVTKETFCGDTIVIGNVGVPSFTAEMLEAFFNSSSKELYLASSSSQKWEFQRFLDMAEGTLPWPGQAEMTGIKEGNGYRIYDFQVRTGEKRVYLIADGVPVNFYRKEAVSLTCSMIDLVFSQMFSIGLALCREKTGGGLWMHGKNRKKQEIFSDQELVNLWKVQYGLLVLENADGCFAGHPNGDYLRDQMFDEERMKKDEGTDTDIS